MASVKSRVEQLEKLLGEAECLCGGRSTAGGITLVVIEEGWGESRIRAAEEAALIVCPVHGRQPVPVLRLSGSDIYG